MGCYSVLRQFGRRHQMVQKEKIMAKLPYPVHSSLAEEEDDPKFHDNDDCPHYHELVHNGHVAYGEGGLEKCDWCKTH
jgi:hypothetical protein